MAGNSLAAAVAEVVGRHTAGSGKLAENLDCKAVQGTGKVVVLHIEDTVAHIQVVELQACMAVVVVADHMGVGIEDRCRGILVEIGDPEDPAEEKASLEACILLVGFLQAVLHMMRLVDRLEGHHFAEDWG